MDEKVISYDKHIKKVKSLKKTITNLTNNLKLIDSYQKQQKSLFDLCSEIKNEMNAEMNKRSNNIFNRMEEINTTFLSYSRGLNNVYEKFVKFQEELQILKIKLENILIEKDT